MTAVEKAIKIRHSETCAELDSISRKATNQNIQQPQLASTAAFYQCNLTCKLKELLNISLHFVLAI